MAYIYQADCYCDDCGFAIRQRLTKEGFAPANPFNKASYDSDEYPKYMDNDEADCPQHCGNGEKCLNAIVIEDGGVGDLFGELTNDGVAYVEDAIREANQGYGSRAVVGLWFQHYTDLGYWFQIKPNWI